MAVSPVEEADVRLTLRNILCSQAFHRLLRLQEFLTFVVTETLAGRGDELKEHTIGVAVYRRPLSYDPKIDAIVRVEAVKLRRRLQFFYQHEGSRAETLIELHKGSYVPAFTRRYDAQDCRRTEGLIDRGNYLLFKFYEKFTPDACSLFRQALQADPSSHRARNSLIHSLWFAAAAEIVSPMATLHEMATLATALGPAEDSNTAVSEMIVNGFCCGDLSRAVAAGRRALDLDPGNLMASVCAGAVLISLGNVTEAENFFRRAIRMHPGILFLRFSQVIALFYGGQAARCTELAADIAAWEPEFWPMQWLLAMVYTAVGRYDEALETAEAALSVRCPPMALIRLAWLYAVTGNREKAEIALQEVEAMSGNAYVPASGFGAVYAALGETHEARNRVREALASREPLLGHAPVDPRLAPLVSLM